MQHDGRIVEAVFVDSIGKRFTQVAQLAVDYVRCRVPQFGTLSVSSEESPAGFGRMDHAHPVCVPFHVAH